MKKKFKPVLLNILVQSNKSIQTIKVQPKDILKLRLCKELSLDNAVWLSAIKMDKHCLDRNVIDLTSKIEESGRERTRAFHMYDLGKV